MIEEYRRSLKHPAAEELFDLWFFRPLGWLFVRLVHRTPITPNQVTILSLAASLAAAWLFATGGLPALGAAAGWYALSNVLDCADGQLARVQRSGTPNGRIVDGVADYIGTTAIFIAIGVGFSRLGMDLWPPVLLAGASSALHAALFDHAQAAFIAASRGEDAARGTAGTAPPGAGGTLPGLYRGYVKVQQRLVALFLPEPKHAPGAAGPVVPGPDELTLIRLWSFLGPTTNRSALIAFALIGRLDLYLWAVIVPGNLWLGAVWYLQRRIGGRVPAGPPPGGGPQ